MDTTTLTAPSPQQLLKSLLIALLTAVVVLVVAVLPAEYGIDPLGLGKALGLTQLNNEAIVNKTVIPNADDNVSNTANPVRISVSDFRHDTKTLTLEPYDGIEMKATMKAGQQFIFNWRTDGTAVFSDMHGERINASDEFSTYWKEKQQLQGSGGFTAPFDGTHGWYWQNMGQNAVTITLEISGFYQSLAIPKKLQ